MKIITLTFALVFSAFSFLSSQTVFGVTVETMGRQMQDDPSLYQRLSGRFAQGDSTLTTQELSLLYYGSAFLPDFNPYREERILDAADALVRREKHYDALSLLDNLLTRHPACLAALLERAYTTYLVNDTLQTEPAYRKYFQLLQIPLTSGAGDSPEKAFVVRSAQDEELVLNELGYVGMEQTLIQRNGQSYHVVSCAKETDLNNRRDFYFNVEIPLKRGLQESVRKKN